jgi:tight adherence protein C
MTEALLLTVGALILGFAAIAEVIAGRETRSAEQPGALRPPRSTSLTAIADGRLGVTRRLTKAGLADRVSVQALLAGKAGGALAGFLWGMVIAPVAPSRLAWIVAAGLPAAGFLAPDAWLERRARMRLRALRAGLPDALDLLAVGTAAGRSPMAGLSELAGGEGPLARELAMLSAESSCGTSQGEALAALRRRAPLREVAAMCGVIERSRRYGSPLADELREQARALRGVQRRRIEEQAARAAPKIQLAVALLLVPSVLLMIAAGLLANIDQFMSGF